MTAKSILPLSLFVCILSLFGGGARAEPIRRVLLVVAMDSEAGPMVSALGLRPSAEMFKGLPMQGYAGKLGELEILLVANGQDPLNKVQNIGTQAATLSTYLGVERFHPDLILSVGSAAGFASQGAKLKDLYVSSSIYFYDRRIPMPGYHEYGLGGYPSASLSALTKKFNLKTGVVCSGNSFGQTETDRLISLKQGCVVIEMEAAGVAWVAMLTKTPMLALKGITDYMQGNDGDGQFVKNFPIVIAAVADKLKEVLTYVSGKSLSQLKE